MEHNNIVAVEDENMTWCENYDAASTEFDMPDAETFMGSNFEPTDGHASGRRNH